MGSPIAFTTKSAPKPTLGRPVAVYRVYNKNSGEYVYTTSAKEYAVVGAAGWHQEGTAWKGL
ncbi:MAG: hypothetical protein LKI34_07295 [Bifidobacterium tibiigranuli]|uniref:hypothetical protein n=1 Tax=Bifidobacterium tibiigranuli TaxID=2172043 RepID=UPI0026EE7F2F|nr:hypothetical protein [Bifidobacterium tibiigranuli]MCI1674000.1 hypothetical protein [Bifidobacterium tibiigranuli]MCI1714028.1 hypothetical protein [Bifidobacterium tibiigranuli]MCI1833418.1 hypothetical protein [Bifidobacterium tibiigranuli]